MAELSSAEGIDRMGARAVMINRALRRPEQHPEPDILVAGWPCLQEPSKIIGSEQGIHEPLDREFLICEMAMYRHIKNGGNP